MTMTINDYVTGYCIHYAMILSLLQSVFFLPKREACCKTAPHTSLAAASYTSCLSIASLFLALDLTSCCFVRSALLELTAHKVCSWGSKVLGPRLPPPLRTHPDSFQSCELHSREVPCPRHEAFSKSLLLHLHCSFSTVRYTHTRHCYHGPQCLVP